MSRDIIRTNDSETYAKVSVPYNTTAEAEAAYAEFYAEFQALRVKYKVPNIIVALQMNATVDGEVLITNGRFALGDSKIAGELVGWQFNETVQDYKDGLLASVAETKDEDL